VPLTGGVQILDTYNPLKNIIYHKNPFRCSDIKHFPYTLLNQTPIKCRFPRKRNRAGQGFCPLPAQWHQYCKVCSSN